jgi:hypothetical protein
MEVGYVRPYQTAKARELDRGPDLTVTALEPDRGPDISDASDMSDLGQIYPTWNQCQCSGT